MTGDRADPAPPTIAQLEEQIARLTSEFDAARRALAQQRHERFKADLRLAVTWLHRRADGMNDPHARGILNTAALTLGTDLRDGRIRRPAQAGVTSHQLQPTPHPLRSTLAFLERESARRATGTHPGMMRPDKAELRALLELLPLSLTHPG